MMVMVSMRGRRATVNSTTQKIIKAALAADDSVSSEQVRAAVTLLNGRIPQQGPAPLLLTQKDAAFLLGVSRFTVRKMVAEGQLHPIKVHEAVRYRRSEIEAIANGVEIQSGNMVPSSAVS